MSSSPLVYAIIVNWNGRQDTLSCLAHLARLSYPSFRIIVVDNGSSDGSEETIREAYPNVTLIQSGANLGFAGGHNLGIRHAVAAQARYIWLLNNDTDVPTDCLNGLVSMMEQVPGLGILGPTVFNRATHRAEPLNPFPPGIARPRIIENREDDILSTLDIELLDTAPGASMLVRRAVLDDLEGLDERYFHFFEDTDLCWRAWQAGWLVGRTGGCRILHEYGASTGASRPRAIYYMLRNILLFASKTSGSPVYTLMTRRPVLWAWALGPLLGLRSWRHPATKVAVLRALWDALRGKEGRCAHYSPP